MSDTYVNSADRAADLTLQLLNELFRRDASPNVAFRLWDGTRWPDNESHPATIVLNHPGALRSMLLPGTEVGLGEAYLYDDFDVEGNLEAVFSLANLLAQEVDSVLQKMSAARSLLKLPSDPGRKFVGRGPARLKGKRHSLERDRQAVTYHYDVSNDFYALWLDQRMVYSCAYFQTANDSLDSAQECKLDYICRKLRLKSDQRLLDIGCGWGGLVIHAAQHYGVDATGITLSQPQAELTNQRIVEVGLTENCRVEVRDYREVNESGSYDAVVSVGMFEHVGEKVLPTYFSQAWELLKPGGVFLNHGIARRFDPNFAYAYAAQAVEVEVDTETGFVRLARVVSADDVGQAINPALVEGQIEGAVVQAQGYVLQENFQMKDGSVLTDQLSTYLIPTVLDVPDEVEPVIVEVPDPRGPWGARGVGELPFLPLAPAILTTIHDATGIWMDSLPVTPERMWRAIQKKGLL